jgi:hypothetical protein
MTYDEMNAPTIEQRTFIAIFCKPKKREKKNRKIELVITEIPVQENKITYDQSNNH